MKLNIGKTRCFENRCYHYHRYQQQHQKQSHRKYFGKRHLDRMHWVVLMEMLLQKDRDLEITVKIGKKLLEQNQELRTRNEFLEEALNTSNDTVIQLRHDLQTRASLLRMCADYDNDLDACTSGRSNSENLQRKMKRLEDENQSLKSESTNLKRIFSELEEKERSHLSEWTKQLDAAHEKIGRLKQSLAEKSEECVYQSIEVERLLKDVSARTAREKSLLSENTDLHQKLEDALTMHDVLTAEVIELQERYTEVTSMLHDAEEELRTYRQNQTAYRTNSADSLYDSLASEIEASDSGFYSAINSARMDIPTTRQQNTQIKTDMTHLRNKLEIIKDRGACSSDATETRSVATATDPLPANRYRQSSHTSDDVVDVPNHVLAELLQRSLPQKQPHLPLPCLEKVTQSANDSGESKSYANFVIPVPETELFEAGSSELKTSTPQQRGRAPDEITVEEAAAQCNVWFARDLNRVSGRSSGSSSTVSKATSTESLASYEGPKMGEPGRPGTRDLDWSIRKLNIRRQVERDYARFRRERGLLSSNTSFFSISTNKKSWSSFGKYHWSPLVHQKTPAAGTLQKQVIANDLSRLFKPWKILANVGLFAALRDSPAQGILVRSAIPFTPPSTPVRQTCENFTRDVPEEVPPHSSYLLEALSLSTPFKTLPFSFTPKRLSQSRSMRNLRERLPVTTKATLLLSTEQLKADIL